MITRYILTGTAAVICASALTAAQAQNPAQQPQTPARPPATTQPASPTASATQAAASVTLSGCLYREQDVPGRTTNPAERAGVGNDFILADARTATGAAAGGATAGAAGAAAGGATAGAAGAAAGGQAGLAAGRMYKLENLQENQLRPLVGKRVEVMGRIDPQDAPAAGARNANEIPDFMATSIKEVTGTCPATPAAGSASPATPATPPNR